MTHIPVTTSVNPSMPAYDDSETRSGSYVDWGSVLGGAVLAAATTSLLLGFGSALGLSMLSPWPAERINGTVFSIIMIIWTVFVPLVSFAVGGYFAGRLRRPWQYGDTDELAFRDAAHGGLVWGTSIVIGALLLQMVAMGAATSMAQNSNMSGSSMMTSTVDALFRSETPIDDAGRQTRDEAQRMLGVGGGVAALSEQDQAYLTGMVSRSTGLPAAEAGQRVTQVLADARSAAETARKSAIVVAFSAAATLLMGLAVAWYAARKGGEHRDISSKRTRR